MTRKEALESGATHYHGKPCKSCGETLKFVTGYSCVTCVTKRTQERGSEVYRKYATSDKGRQRAKEYRKTDTHKSIQNQYNRARYAKDPTPYKDRNYQNRYGITMAQYEAMLQSQDYRCAICDKHRDVVPHKRLVVDHCHDTNAVRKLLCSSCNVALGMLHESVDIMGRMIDYVKEFKKE